MTHGPCEYCGPVCYRGAAHNARAEDSAFLRRIAPTEGATMTDSYGLGDQLRIRVPVWRCTACKLKFYSPEEYEAHRAEELALKEKV